MRGLVECMVSVLLGAGLAAGMGAPAQGVPAKGEVDAQQRHNTHKALRAGDYGSTETIDNLLSQGTGDVVIKHSHITSVFGPANPPPYPPYPLVGMACTSDAAVMGAMGHGSSAPMRGDAFLYTDTEFKVEEVLKDNPKAPIKPGTTIIVTRPGGVLTVKGRTVRAIDPNFKDFRPGRRYLLFLQYIPTTEAYEANAENGFELLGPKVAPLTEYWLWEDLEADDAESLLQAARDAVDSAQACGKEAER
jgi:hypothetical protein